jgi:L-fuculose-phosphate aldolase
MTAGTSKDQLRRAIVAKARWMHASGLTHGTSGNISARFGHGMLITPSALPYQTLKPSMLAEMALDSHGDWEGSHKPSTEWPFHSAIYRARPEVGAIVHTHSTFATALSIARRSIPACHYMVAAFGGSNVRCADYATPGSANLSKAVLGALEGRTACLLANHGAVAVGADLDHGMWLAETLETVAEQYYRALLIGGPILLSERDVNEMHDRMQSYGMQELGESRIKRGVRRRSKPRR